MKRAKLTLKDARELRRQMSAPPILTQPWEYTAEIDDNHYPITQMRAINNGRGRVVAHVACAFGDGEEVAKLIAAAPAMLAALRHVIREFDERNAGLPDDAKLGDTPAIAAARVVLASQDEPA